MLQPQEENAPQTRKQRKRSAKRAKKLLLHHLDPGQRKQLRRKGHFDVIGSRGTVFRVSSSFPFNVRLAGFAKRSRVFFCTEAEDPDVPRWDVVLGQKLLIEADEGEFLKVANLEYIPKDAQDF